MMTSVMMTSVMTLLGKRCKIIVLYTIILQRLPNEVTYLQLVQTLITIGMYYVPSSP